MNIQLLEQEFIGIGEVGMFTFTQIDASEKAYIYKVTSQDGAEHYEVIKRSHTPICLDFDKRLYSETEHKEVYPKSTKGGTALWTKMTEKAARVKFNELNN